jgi:hypothetical protein
MGGGLLQLVAYGAQDVYLTGNPQITFWKVSYRRYTNFSMESIEQSFNGTAGAGQRITCQISRNGDLVHKIYLELNIDGATDNVRNGGVYVLIKEVEVEIGGQRIDKQFGHWMFLWNQLTLPTEKRAGMSIMTGVSTGTAATTNTTNVNAGGRYYLPLEFWFCRNPGLALPLIALQYHEVKINILFESLANIRDENGAATLTLTSTKLWADYIFLDTDERRRMAQNPHEYLIDQVQQTSQVASATGLMDIKLNFNHPVKELVWTQRDPAANVNAFFANGLLTTSILKLNGHDRFAQRDSNYFSQVQPYQHHTGVPSTFGFATAQAATLPNPSGINVYSFALRPEEHQPSGTCNFSRIDSAILKVDADNTQVTDVYAVNYNVLRIMSGMGGLAYSN